MRTTMSLDDVLIKELMEVTKAKTKTEAIHTAIAEFLRRKKIEGLLALEGKIHLNLDWRELEEQELKAQEEHERLWRGHRKTYALDPHFEQVPGLTLHKPPRHLRRRSHSTS